MRRRLSVLGLLGFALVWVVPVPAQESPSGAGQDPAPIFRTSADLVTIDAVVTDGDGRHVTDLTPADFEVRR